VASIQVMLNGQLVVQCLSSSHVSLYIALYNTDCFKADLHCVQDTMW